VSFGLGETNSISTVFSAVELHTMRSEAKCDEVPKTGGRQREIGMGTSGGVVEGSWRNLAALRLAAFRSRLAAPATRSATLSTLAIGRSLCHVLCGRPTLIKHGTMLFPLL